MNILCVCGNGIGTSVLLKVNVESVARPWRRCQCHHLRCGSAKGIANMNDLVLTSAELAPELEGTTTPVEVITNFMDTDEIKSVLEKYAD